MSKGDAVHEAAQKPWLNISYRITYSPQVGVGRPLPQYNLPLWPQPPLLSQCNSDERTQPLPSHSPLLSFPFLFSWCQGISLLHLLISVQSPQDVSFPSEQPLFKFKSNMCPPFNEEIRSLRKKYTKVQRRKLKLSITPSLSDNHCQHFDTISIRDKGICVCMCIYKNHLFM